MTTAAKEWIRAWAWLIVGVSMLAASMGCHQVTAQNPAAPSVAPVSVAVAADVPPVVVTPPVAETPKPEPPVVDCSAWPWAGFNFIVRLDHVAIWNHSSCARQTSWRAFAIQADGSQPAIGRAVVTTTPAGYMDWRVDVHYDGGQPPCGSTIQIDGRPGNQPAMDHSNASFPPHVLFTTPPCYAPPPPPPPPPACVDPGWGPWTTVNAAKTAQVCQKQERTRTLCNGTVERETRTVCQ